MSPQEPPRIFISYARSDGEVFARHLRALLEAEALPLWRDREGMEGGRDWWQQITAAIDQVEFLVLVMTPAATQSALVRREWRYARQRGVSVYPVFGADDAPSLDIRALPHWMRSVHFYDLRNEWPKFVRDLHARPTPVRVPFMVDDLPADFVPRPAEYEQLLSHLLDRQREEPVAITTALRGAGGFGKTALARALCHDEAIQNAFDDGILWVTLGESPGDLTGRVEDLIYMLSGQRPGFASVDSATASLVELLADRDVLLVIDDAWSAAHVRPFLQGGPRCARVITTRRSDVPPPQARRINVDAMSSAEAVALLGQGLVTGDDNAAALAGLAARLGEWPLLLKLVNAALQERVVERGEALAAALDYVGRVLDQKGLTYFDARDARARDNAVATTLGVSLAQLGEPDRQRLHELAVFPEDVDAPLKWVGALWSRTAALDEIDTEDLCARLARLSLLLDYNLAGRTIRLHDVVRQFLIGGLGPRLAALQLALLDAVRPRGGQWHALDTSDRYGWSWLFTHLRAARQDAELQATALDLRYLATKSVACSPLAVEADLALASMLAPTDSTLALLRRCFAQTAHLLALCRSVAEAHTTLLGRLAFVPGLQPLMPPRVDGELRLVPVDPPPDMPHPALIRTLGGHRGAMSACALAADGKLLATADADRLIRLWDAANGVERLQIKDHSAHALALSRDGTVLAAATHDRRLVLWDTATGHELMRGAGHLDALTGVALNLEHRRALTSSIDGTARLWDIDRGVVLMTLEHAWTERDSGALEPTGDSGHRSPVLGCAISADASRLATASSDQTVILWDAVSGRALRVLQGHDAAVNACAFNPSGRRLASAGADHTVLLWDCDTGEQRLLAGHGGSVKAVVWSDTDDRIVSASADGTVRVWDASGRREIQAFYGHTDWVVGCAVAHQMVASVSIDRTARLWDLTPSPGAPVSRRRDSGWVWSCAACPSTSLLVTTRSDRGLLSWDPKRHRRTELMRGHEATVRGCATSDDGCLVAAAAGKAVVVWDTARGSKQHTLSGHRDWVNDCCFGPGGTLLASVSNDRTLRLWDLGSRARRLALTAHRHGVTSCAVSPDGRWVISAAADGSIRRWPLDGIDESLWEAWLSNSRELSLDVASAALQPLELVGHTGNVNQIEMAPDGSLLASASSDHSLRLWEPDSGRCVGVLEGHELDVNGCDFSPDSRHLASVSSDGCLKVWRVSDGLCLASMRVDGLLSDCAWTDRDGALVAVGAMGVYFLECRGLAP